jgi:hypothetical protein
MTISTAALIALTLWLVSRAIARHIRSHWQADGTVQSVSRAGIVGGLAFLSSISSSALVALALVWVLLSVVSSVPMAVALGGLQIAQVMHGLAVAAQSWMGRLIFLATLAALYFMWVRPSSQAIAEAYEVARRRELERLQKEYEAGRWPDQPSTAEMQDLERTAAAVHRELEALRQQPDEARARALTTLLAQIRSAWFGLDVQRRMNPDYALASSIFARSGADRACSILALLMSRSAHQLAGRGQNLVARVVSVLLVLSIVGWAGTVADAQGTYLDLRSARLAASKQQALESLENARGQAPRAQPEAEIEALAEQFDHAFVQGLSEYLRVQTPGVRAQPGAAATVQRLVARRHILDAATVADAKRSVRVESADLTKLEAEIIERADHSSIGRRFVDDLRRDGLLESDEFWRRIRTDRFGPVSLRTASETALSEVVGEVLRGTLPGPEDATEIQKLALGVERTAARKAVMRFYTDAYNRFVTDIAEGVKPTEALKGLSSTTRLRSTNAERAAASRAVSNLPNWDDLAARLSQREPALAHVESMADETVREYANRIRDLPDEAARARGVQAVRNVGSTYDDFFPRHSTPSSGTSGSMVGEALANALGGSRPAASPVPTSGRVTAAARSARLVRGLRFVGGVVIGDLPDDGNGTASNDLSWDREGGRIGLAMAFGTRRVRLGRFDPAVVRQALLYAADGRTVAVTMTSIGATRRGLKVLAHPALIDTPLGNDIIEVDRLVDTHGRTDGRTPTDEQVFLSLQLAAAQILCHEDGATEARTKIAEIRPRLAPLLGRLSDPSWSLFAARPQYFDASVQTAVRACAAGLDACVVPSGTRSSCAGRESWSGVRERGFALADVTTPFTPTDAESRFLFLIQVVFVDPPVDSPPDSDVYIDPDPWEYPAAQAAITERVLDRMSPAQRSAVQRTWQFTYLQRLFRAILDGRLGVSLPSRLVALARDTSADVVVEATPRWSRDPVPARFQPVH